jgi:superfamily II DNA or RNA helicase
MQHIESQTRGEILSEDHELGLNVLQRMISKGLGSFGCDELECMAYNVSLDLVLRLFEEYPLLKKISIWSNTERITYSPKNRAAILSMIDSKRIDFFHVPENVNAIHGKLYSFKKNGSIQFLAVGSPNFSEHSNQNFESLIYVHDSAKCKTIWEEIPRIYTDLNLLPEKTIPVQIEQAATPETKMDHQFFDGLWKHQIEVLSWLASRRFSIVNIPPGTGKTEIAFTYLRYLFEKDKDLTVIVLVPTTTLICQWTDRLKRVGIANLEWGTDPNNLGNYFADPSHKVLVTLYSRFFDQYVDYQKKAKILKPNLLLILDECHDSYGHLDDLLKFRDMMESFGGQIYSIGLSATIDSFRVQEVTEFIDLMGGKQNRFEISLQSFYAHWNNLNPTPVLKPINYTPIKYRLSNSEMEKFSEYSRKIAIQMGKETLAGPNEITAAIQRARWLRGLQGGVELLQDYIMTNLDNFAQKSTIVFVQTNEIATNLQSFMARQPGWNPEASIYIYDSYHENDYRSYALEQFKRHIGFCLISEHMLSEGFDLPKVDGVILHGSHRSPRDWIQKIGRAIRFDPADPDSVAEIVDVVFCDTGGEPLDLEKERYECLMAISQ